MTVGVDHSAGEPAVAAEPSRHAAPASLAAVIVNYNGGTSLLDCVASLLAQDISLRILVVDNDSSDGSVESLQARYPHVEVLETGVNLGFGAAANAGARASDEPSLLFLNPDIVLAPGCVAGLLETLDGAPGVVGPGIDIAASQAAVLGLTINALAMPTSSLPGVPPLYVAGCALAVRRDVFEAVGGFDERYFLFVEDVEFCWRVLLAGFEVSVNPVSQAHHEGGAVAPGGYPRSGARYSTSALRVALRERNSITMMLCCCEKRRLAVVLPTMVGRTLCLATGALVLGHPRLAAQLVGGLAWNLRELKETLARRRSLARSPAGAAEARRRFRRRALLLRTLRAHGLPRIDAN